MIDSYAPKGMDAISQSVLWVQQALLGASATIVATIAVAAVGMLMLSGRVDVQRGLRTIFGCFLLFGAPAIAAAFMGMSSRPPSGREEPAQQVTPLPVLPAEAPYDPYAGAAVPSTR